MYFRAAYTAEYQVTAGPFPFLDFRATSAAANKPSPTEAIYRDFRAAYPAANGSGMTPTGRPYF